ncbi:ubiquitin carboxyl-terminal hydrolase 42-like [Rana temporaria]|uniref:ubiquitin carboxyl-terminal hydrolase 42-like n=1 Tax=Rana temporaria TaxID=8407 RepID=UPI001AACD24D|nr:ubiquitin carboxyl-terminal hydrolase 42-like [Rana temporaria]
MPKLKGGMGVPDLLRYHKACLLTRIVDWHVHRKDKDWVELEEAFVGFRISHLPWVDAPSTPKSCKSHPLIGPTLACLRKTSGDSCPAPYPGPLTPLNHNPGFPDGVDAADPRKTTERMTQIISRADLLAALQQGPTVGAGLVNLGNTCFANSVLQCLTHTHPIADYMLMCKHSQKCRLDTFCMMCTMEIHINMAFNYSDAMSPYIVIDQLQNIAEHFELGQQEDAHEFLLFVIDKMQNSCIYDYPLELSFSQRKTSNLMDSLFAGSLRIQLDCQNCQYTSDRYEKFLDIGLDINSSNTVPEALKDLVKGETLEGDNAYRCGQCNQLVTAKMRSMIHEAPIILPLCLKRFDVFTGAKLTKKISYPEILNVSQYTTRKEDINYNLYAVLVHRGYSCQSGHYYAYVKARNDQWYLMNDEQVTPCNVNTVLNQEEAYLLFYMRAPTEQRKKQQASCSQRANSSDQTTLRPQKENVTSVSKDGAQKPCSNTREATVRTRTGVNKRKARQDDSPMERSAKQRKKDSVSNSSFQHQETQEESTKPRSNARAATVSTRTGVNKRKARQDDSPMERSAKQRKKDSVSNSTFQHQETQEESTKPRSNARAATVSTRTGVNKRKSRQDDSPMERSAKQRKKDSVSNSNFQHQETKEESAKPHSNTREATVSTRTGVNKRKARQDDSPMERSAKQRKKDSVSNSTLQHQETKEESTKPHSNTRAATVSTRTGVNKRKARQDDSPMERSAKQRKKDSVSNSTLQHQETKEESTKPHSNTRAATISTRTGVNKRKARQDDSPMECSAKQRKKDSVSNSTLQHQETKEESTKPHSNTRAVTVNTRTGVNKRKVSQDNSPKERSAKQRKKDSISKSTSQHQETKEESTKPRSNTRAATILH